MKKIKIAVLTSLLLILCSFSYREYSDDSTTLYYQLKNNNTIACNINFAASDRKSTLPAGIIIKSWAELNLSAEKKI